MRDTGNRPLMGKMVFVFVGLLLAVFITVDGAMGRNTREGAATAGLTSAEWGQISTQLPVPMQAVKLAADDAQISDFFGSAVAVDGDIFVVGALGEAGGPGDPLWHAGAAYVFERNQGGPGSWGQVAKLTAGDPGFMDEFGHSVAVSGDTIAIGTPFENGGDGHPLLDAGAVYIFERDQGGPGNWGQVIKLMAGDPGEEDDFGRTISLNGDTLVVGSPGEDGGPGDPMSYIGAVYVFERDQGGPDNWGQVIKLLPGDAQPGDGFGNAVAVSGDTLVAGSPTERGGPGDPLPWAGAAYVFERNQGGAGNWGEVAKLTASDAQPNDRLGSALAVDGDTIVVSAPFEEGGPGDPLFVAGAAYVYERDQGGPGNWGEVTKLVAADPDEHDFFGSQVAVLGDLIVSGTPYESGGPGDPLLRAGAAYVFERDQAGNWGQVGKLTADDAQAEDIFGSDVAIGSEGLIFVGALDGDAEGPPPVTDSGAAYIFDLAAEVTYSVYLPALFR